MKKATLAFALALTFVLTSASSAFAYYSFGAVDVLLGSTSVSLEVDGTTSISVGTNPASHDQTLGCNMAKCPQICSSPEVEEAGFFCFDVNGQCTCSGPEYSTYYASMSAYSSDTSVASAYLSGGTLVITGNSAGTATITVNGSLRQWQDGSNSVTVTVAEKKQETDKGDNKPSSGSSSNKKPQQAVGIPEAATETDSRDDALNEVVTETTAGTVYTVENNSFLNTREQLLKVAGTKGQVIIWSGASSTRPTYSMTFYGKDLSEDNAYLDFDPSITVSKVGTGTVANIMFQAGQGLVLECAQGGSFPATADVYVLTEGTFASGMELSLFKYDMAQRKFNRVSDGIKVENGYAFFQTSEGGTYALSEGDLSVYSVQGENNPVAIRESKDATATTTTEQSIATDSNSVVVPVAVGVIVVAVIAGLVLVLRKKRVPAAPADSPKADGVASAASKAEGAAPVDDLPAKALQADVTEEQIHED